MREGTTKKFRKILLPLLLVAVVGSFFIGSVVLAQSLQTGLQYGTATGLGNQDVRISVMNIVRAVLAFLGVLALLIVIYGGWVWMTAGGNADRIAQAKRILVNAVIGLVIILSAFIITSFIINQLLGATGAGPGAGQCTTGQINPNNSCQICQAGVYVNDFGLPGCIPPSNQCVIINITPAGVNKPMNSVARVRFSLPVTAGAGTIEVYDVTNGPLGVLVPTTQNVSGNTVELIPIASCPPPNAGLNCFVANSNFEIRSDDPLIECGGEPLVCGGLGGNNCLRTFSTSNALDLFPPSISIINNQVCQDPASRLEAFVNDDYGIAYVDFFENSNPAGSDGYVTVPPAEIASIPWDTSGYTVGDVITIDATAVDYDTNTTAATPADIPIRAGHCCNLVQDQDETGLNCGGNDCEPCTPVIEWVDPLDGAPGNLITIHGRRFDSLPGTVNFIGGNLPGVLPVACSAVAAWSDKQIITGVPNLTPAQDGAIQVVRADGESDRTDQAPGTILPDFNANTNVRPGLCQVVPPTGPVALPILLNGINFTNPVDVYFGGLPADGNPNAVLSTLIASARVPLLSNGDVQVRSVNVDSVNPVNSEFSNPVLFKVDSTFVFPPTFKCSSTVLACAPGDANDALCNPNFSCDPTTCTCVPNPPPLPPSCDSDQLTPVCDPDNALCSGGYICDPNSCTCQPSVAAGARSTYTWFFTTTSLGPRVAETCNRSGSCDVGSISSPTPFSRTGTNVSGARVGNRPDDGAVPIDAIIGATFTEQMQATSLNASTITVSECGSANAPFNPASCAVITGTITATPINFEFIPNGALTTDSWYRATLNAAQIFGANGVSLAPNDPNNNYSWVFKTRTVATPGEVGCVYIEPAVQTSYLINALSDGWNGQAADKDFACVVLNPQTACSVGWSWSTGGLEVVINSAVVNNAITQALAETVPGPGVPVIAGCTTPVGSIAGTATHNVDFSSPVVIARFPNCGSACLNSKVGATFSLPMDNTSVANALSLHICFDDPSCAPTPQNQVPFNTWTPNDPSEAANSYTGTLAGGDIDNNGQDDYWLLPNTYYRVVVSGTAQSAIENKPLVNLNYDTDGILGHDAFSWVFKTKPNYGICLPYDINVKPESALAAVGDSLLYAGVAKTSADQCFGQSLDPYSFNWAWQSTDTAVANFRGFPTWRDACGNGVIEQGEDCDDGNLTNSDGCDSVCLTEGDPDQGNNNYNVDICGNGIIEPTEQCENPGSRGCSNNCTLSGSVPPLLSRCGDGVIGLGEQCDDADLLLGGLAQSGDGCSSSCLVEDPNSWFCRSTSTLRFEFKKGECSGNSDCNIGSTGYTCVRLQDVGGNTNTGSVCGNGVIESKEECDFGTEPNGDGSDGCSDWCINQGSVQEVNDPPTVGPFQIVDAVFNGSTTIQSWIASFVPPAGPLGRGDLQVGSSLGAGDPQVVERYPDCGTACSNAGMGAVFNVSLAPLTLNSTNITLYECGANSQCVITGLSSVPVTITRYATVSANDSININLPLTYNPTDVDGSGTIIPTLLPNTYYRVVVSNRVQNPAGRGLVGLNFDDPNDSAVGLDSHSWIFRTQTSSAACTVGRVEVHPEKLTLPEGTLQTYFAEPWTLGGSCDPLFGSNRGQRLNAYFYDWRWDTFETDGINAADMLVPLRDGCGNTVVEFGEDCDDGNLVSGDGCSGAGSPLSLCQHEGSVAPALCGNSLVETGEDCDDGNTTSGDGCSSSCLHEGNINYGVAVCGNGQVEAGEQCDTGSEPNGTNTDGCTDICTFSGAVTGTNSICGDGQVTLGENCDTGELSSGASVISNDGCTGTNLFSPNPCAGLTQTVCQNPDNAQWCAWTGSACQTRACLNETTIATGNTNWNLAVCGNGAIELGEECDLGTEPDGNTADGCTDRCLFAGSVYADGRIDPYQIVQTSAIGSPVAEVNEEIRAWHNLAPTIVGVGELKVVSGGLVDFAVVGHKPPVGDPNLQCLNISISATFSRQLNVTTLEDNFRLCEGAACDFSSPNLAEELSYRKITGSCVNNACRFPQADAANLDFGFCSNSSDCAGSQVSVKKVSTPDGFLARTQTYKIIINPDQLLDSKGTALTIRDGGGAILRSSCSDPGTECNWSFRTSENFCNCDSVGVEITNTSGGADTAIDTFTCAGNTCGADTEFELRDDDADSGTNGNQHYYEATCYDVNNPSGSRIALNPLGQTFNYLQFDKTDTLVDFPLLPSFDPVEVVTANAKNGKADVRVIATEYTCTGTSQLCDPGAPICPVGATCRGKQAASRTVVVTNFICSNPWPDLSTFPYRDNEDNAIAPDTNFHLFYCRDFGGPGIDDDLPTLNPALISSSGGASIKDFLFPVGTNGDGIGIKVLKNPLHLSPSTWYRSGLCNGQTNFENLCFNNADCAVGETCQFNIFSQGSFNDLTVDGYEAVRGGRTVYVGAPNLSAPNLYSNLYLISYNQNAAPSTVEIFNRILDPAQQKGAWTFNNPPEVTNHRFCQNVGYYSGTDLSCRHIGTISATYCSTLGSQFSCTSNAGLGCFWDSVNTVCLGNDCSINDNKDACEDEATRGCVWSGALNDCLSLVCEPITCTNDFECPNLSCNADKEMLVRDAKRFGNLRDIQILLENYSSQIGVFPSIRAGSYIASTTFSVWPSWQQTLARDLGTSLTVDPINRFVGCPGFTCDANGNGDIEAGEDTYCNAAVDTTTCPAPGKCVPVDTDQARTCWDEVNLQFSCPVDSLVYAYRASANNTTYQLFSRFEYEGVGSWRTAAAPNLYRLPLSNLVGPSCQRLNLEISAATVAGGTVPPVLNDLLCFNGGPTDGTITCTLATMATDCDDIGQGIRCSADADGDGIPDFGSSDNCAPSQDCFDFPNFNDCWNPDQRDASNPKNDIGDACDPTCSDNDKDGVCGQIDNCPNVWNPNQVDVDDDDIGDVCDLCIDIDNDGYGSPGSTACQFGAALDCRDNPGAEPLASSIYPGALENCSNTVDDNCDGLADAQDTVACPVDTCSDTDAGQTDYTTKGTTTGKNSGQSFANSDFCTSQTGLTEYGCNGTTRAQNSVNCVTEFGANWQCSDGKCIPPLPQPDSCADSDGSLTNAQTLGTVSGFENSGQAYTNTDACSAGVLTEWGCIGTSKTSSPIICSTLGAGWSCSSGVCVPPPPPPDSCTDSDGGAVITTAGNTSGFSGGVTYTNNDSCQGNQVREYTCSGTSSTSTLISCSGSDVCQSGRCVPPANSCSDSDNSPTNYITVGITSGFNGGTPYSNQDSCSGNTLTEYGCSSTNQTSGSFNCTTLGLGYACQSGRCVPPPDSCADTDGTNYQNLGTVSGFSGGSTYSFNDSCQNATNVTEWTCSASSAISSNVSCATQFGAGYGCNSGRCVLNNESSFCFDGLDNDIDGATDCADSDCVGSANGIGQVCCATNANCSTWINGNVANNCASLATCNAVTRTCLFTPSNTLCGTGTNACGVCNPVTGPNPLTCSASTTACNTGVANNCGLGCQAVSANNYQCQGTPNLCVQVCSTCQNSSAGIFTCANVNNTQDCDGPGASQCCLPGFLCNSLNPPQCVSCTDSDKDGFCDNNDVCPYDPDNNSDSSLDNLCAVGCIDNGSHTRTGPYTNGYLCDGPPDPSVVVYDTCQGGGSQVSSGICTGSPLRCSNNPLNPCSTNADCTNFITGGCTATNSCLVLFGADERLNVYINGRMVAGNLYLPAGFVENGELLGGNGNSGISSNSYPNITKKIFFNLKIPGATTWFVDSGPTVVSFEALSRTWNLRQIRGAFVNSTETDFCGATSPLFNYTPKYTQNLSPALPVSCYTDDNSQNTGLAPAAQGALAWNDVGFIPGVGWIPTVPGAPTAGPLSNLFSSSPPWMLNKPAAVWSKTYGTAFTYSHAYCRSAQFTQP